MQVNQESITKQLIRAYNARGPVSPSGALGLSPIIAVGAAAHPSIATHIAGCMSAFITAAAGQTGGVGLIVPVSAQGQLAVVNSIVVASSSTAATYTLLIDGPTADTDYAPTQFPTNRNTQNVAKGTVPMFWGYVSTAASPATGTTLGTLAGGSGLDPQFGGVPIVLQPGWGIVVHCNTVALSYGIDINFDVFEQTPT